MQSKFKEFYEYLSHGLSPIPLNPGKKNPRELSWQEYCSEKPSEEKVKESGKLYIKGKDYIVEDGDILSIMFNV